MTIDELLKHVITARESLFMIDMADEYTLPRCLPCMNSLINDLYVVEGYLIGKRECSCTIPQISPTTTS